jgi:hypothetical protein
MEKEVIQVEIPAGKKAAWVDGFLKLVDAEEEQKKDERPITERVKTFEDACKELGEDHKLVQQFKAIQEAIAEDKEATAYFKLGIITAALNEGWEPDFTNDDEYRYYPYLCLWTKEELEDKDEEWKDDHNLQLWIGGGVSNFGADCGLAFAPSYNAWSLALAYISARLAHKTEELAIYSGKQFTELWTNYTTGKEVTSWRNI